MARAKYDIDVEKGIAVVTGAVKPTGKEYVNQRYMQETIRQNLQSKYASVRLRNETPALVEWETRRSKGTWKKPLGVFVFAVSVDGSIPRKISEWPASQEDQEDSLSQAK